jgi:hypothetical protein
LAVTWKNPPKNKEQRWLFLIRMRWYSWVPLEI